MASTDTAIPKRTVEDGPQGRRDRVSPGYFQAERSSAALTAAHFSPH